nr:spore coat associated protein CotJA [uncultured Blautia sp.]
MEYYGRNQMMSRSCRIQPRETKCGCCDKIEDMDIYKHADHLPLTMAYVPMQHFSNTFALCKGLQMGTIFPELCKPFCGKRGGCRC